ncbi:MAG: hypothetical protein COV02_02160 [Candidatus Terrybacteria bacterium CG10_big_fil_rev_8_21_14_0_10_41_10]|uniref:Uncharacterized protein n=1 Tax=Candidatus Terrybacteria bacterium CG10_big_fil_rev_8_21_14_0_10_41_10 TaxID=1975026 RepID=A0A2M8LA67_9BACT|nr:MAG: hypothetical protein COV02_02160 [Candidatus Terrybacteria bacterium CG10_big_fil_rev_8_21_14_0_10_41_10]
MDDGENYISLTNTSDTSYSDNIYTLDPGYIGSETLFKYKVNACNASGDCSDYVEGGSVTVPTSEDCNGTGNPPVSDPDTISLSAESELYATVLDGLPANSNTTKITAGVGDTCDSIELSITNKPIDATFELDPTIIRPGETSKLTVKSIPGITLTDTYIVVVTGKGANGANCTDATVDIPINVQNITTRWEEF